MSISNVFIVAAQLYKQSQDKVLVDKQTNKQSRHNEHFKEIKAAVLDISYTSPIFSISPG